MSFYDPILEKAAPHPAYPNKRDFTTTYGYAGGKSLGTFPDAAAAKAAGAKTTESNIDLAKFNAARTEYQNHYAAIRAEWEKVLREQYPEVNDAVFGIAYAKAYEDGHSAGHGEVENYLSNYIDMAQQIIAAAKEG